MTASVVPTSATSKASLVRSAVGLADRGLRRIRRLPSAFFPALVMPIFQCIAFSGTFFAITRIPGFPTHRSINWFLPLALCMGSAFSGVGLGFTLIGDLETGFFDRLRMAPSPRNSLILGPLLTAWFRTFLVVTVVLVVGVAMGARPTGGPLGILMLYVAGLGIATIATGWGLGLAFRFRDMRAAAIMQLGLFLTLFVSTAQAPLNVMRGWLHGVARLNPVTNILRLARQGFLGEVTWASTWGGLLAIVIMSAILLTFARRGLDGLDR
jgi:ABC-type multidrug transport system permease subunit